MNDSIIRSYCPQCGGIEVERERRMGGNAKCENGHTYPSATALSSNVGFDDEDEDAFTAESNDEVINIINKS